MSESAELQRLEKQMERATTYEEWRSAAASYDDLSGWAIWKQRDKTALYDYETIRERYELICKRREEGDWHGLVFALNEGVHGNMGGMGSAALHSRSLLGTKKLIEDYVNEICEALQDIAEVDEKIISRAKKIDLFHRASDCFGRSAMMLSGGGSLGYFHLGVVKALMEHDLLPTVLSGSSAGSLVAAVIGTHTDDELEQYFDHKQLLLEMSREANILQRLFWGNRTQLDESTLTEILERVVPDMTFEEAYNKTGRSLNISVSPAKLNQSSRLLNAKASPNVTIRSAVMASCAVPGVFPSVSLRAKDVHGEETSYLANRRWVDGSVSGDLPAKRLARLFGVNHFIVSMINPMVLPFINLGESKSGILKLFGQIGHYTLRESIGAYQQFSRRYLKNWPRLNLAINGVHTLLNQEYTGDINIAPSFRWIDPRKVLSHIDESELLQLIDAGERATWPQIDHIELSTRIGRKLDHLLEEFPAQTKSHAKAKAPKLSVLSKTA